MTEEKMISQGKEIIFAMNYPETVTLQSAMPLRGLHNDSNFYKYYAIYEGFETVIDEGKPFHDALQRILPMKGDVIRIILLDNRTWNVELVERKVNNKENYMALKEMSQLVQVRLLSLEKRINSLLNKFGVELENNQPEEKEKASPEVELTEHWDERLGEAVAIMKSAWDKDPERQGQPFLNPTREEAVLFIDKWRNYASKGLDKAGFHPDEIALFIDKLFQIETPFAYLSVRQYFGIVKVCKDIVEGRKSKEEFVTPF